MKIRFICGAAFLWTLSWGSPVHVVKQNGQPALTSKATLSADGKSMTVEDTLAGSTQKVIETWMKK
jgi:hypothetical protein